MFVYDTITEAVKGLKERGFTIDFNLEYDCIVCHDTPISLLPDEFEIVEIYRFEGNTDPADEAIVFAIQGKNDEKGILVNGFGVYTDAVSDEMVKKLSVRHTVN